MALPQVRELRRRDVVIVPVAIFFATLMVYVLTLCPTVFVGDSGEFITNAYLLGINHPTGYPLYTLLNRVMIILAPFWSPAYAVNFFSAISAALTAALSFFVLRRFTARREVLLAVPLLYGFSFTLWSRATSAEVYTLNTLFVMLALVFLFRWYFQGRLVDLVALSYVAGLGLSQHVTGTLVAFCIPLLVVLKRPRILLEWKSLLLIIAVGILGFSSYLYLPIRSASDPPLDWGNPETMQNLIGHFFPKGLTALFGETKSSSYEERVFWFVAQAVTKEFWFFGILAIVGFVVLSSHWRVLVFFLAVIGSNVYFTIARKLPLHADFDAYFLPTYIVMALSMGIALAFLVERIERVWHALSSARLATARTAAFLVFPVALLAAHYDKNDRSETYFAEDFGKNMLATVENSAILFTVGDEQTFLGWYFKYVEKLRPDVTIIDRNLLGARWGGSHMYNRYLNLPLDETKPPEALAREIIALSIDQRPVYFTHRLPWDFVAKEYDLHHNGMTIQVLTEGMSKEYVPTNFGLRPGWHRVFFDERMKLMVSFYPKEYIDNALFWYRKGNKEAALNEASMFLDFPLRREREDLVKAYLLRGDITMGWKRFEDAQVALDSALVYGPADWRVYELRGNLSFLLNDSSRALAEWRTSLEFHPDNPRVKRNVEVLSQALEGLMP